METFGIVTLTVVIIAIFLRWRFATRKTENTGDITFKSDYEIDDYEAEINSAVFEVRRCRTLVDKIQLCHQLTRLCEGIFGDYEDNDVYNELSQTLDKSFIFRYSAFITLYPEPQTETALERIYLTQTKQLCPENMIRHHFDGCYISDETPAEINIAIDDFFSLMVNVAYDGETGYYIESDDETPAALTNTIHNITRDDLIAWFDDELVFRSFLAVTFLNACRDKIEAEEKAKLKTTNSATVKTGNKIVK
ncbi:hypothetical protein L9H26_00135 [Morganella psychrotolerans]|uniref:Uncharacterized protein n=1 Tax=Morganella psychrotolerans TaxID=368603 RepID=A0A5M9QZF8_9GAMM|nr:hypothetical protein [Morganella psychrotolerans]KAA8713581.1 hypothetical protein F4V73_16720 [Morganella psychrotolerans]